MTISRTGLFVIVVMMSACSLGQTIPMKKSGTTQDDADSDLIACNIEALSFYPKRMVNLMEDRYITDCKTQTDNTYCTTKPYPYTPYDSNEMSRFKFNTACMIQKGYTN